VELVHDKPDRELGLLLGFGIATVVSAVASHHSAKTLTLGDVVLPKSPMAMHQFELHDASRRTLMLPTFKLGVTDHTLPFHDSISVLVSWSLLNSSDPTATQREGETQETLVRELM
ncbi:MAG: hypothetical protein WAM97_19600, partial [Acidimicrobiales bacterium]